MTYFLYFLLAGAAAIVVTPVAKRLAFRFGAVDVPNEPRKIHKKPTALLGGLGVFVAFGIATVVYLLSGNADFGAVPLKSFGAIFAACIVLIIGGFLDDKYKLSAKITWLFPAIASLLTVMCGVGLGVTFISNPFGGTISLENVIWGIPVSGVLAFVWLMGMTYTTKLLDGMDGLVSGVGAIAAITLFFLSLTPKVNQPVTATLAIILAGACLGFLVYNYHPASIFLGEGGSTMIGFLLGALSIVLGGKIATALLVMGIPILDVAWAIVRRLYGRKSPFMGDRKHLHFRLLDIGLNQRQAVLVLWTISAIFGFTAVFLQSLGKLIALGVVLCVMVALIMLTVVVYKRQEKSK